MRKRPLMSSKATMCATTARITATTTRTSPAAPRRGCRCSPTRAAIRISAKPAQLFAGLWGPACAPLPCAVFPGFPDKSSRAVASAAMVELGCARGGGHDRQPDTERAPIRGLLEAPACLFHRYADPRHGLRDDRDCDLRPPVRAAGQSRTDASV